MSRRRGLIASGIATVVLLLAMSPAEERMQDTGGPGMVPFELTGGQDGADEILSEWGDDGQDAARESLWIDFGFLIAYGAFLTLALAAVRDLARQRVAPPCGDRRGRRLLWRSRSRVRRTRERLFAADPRGGRGRVSPPGDDLRRLQVPPPRGGDRLSAGGSGSAAAQPRPGYADVVVPPEPSKRLPARIRSAMSFDSAR